jgi:hypothetical protein
MEGGGGAGAWEVVGVRLFKSTAIYLKNEEGIPLASCRFFPAGRTH